MRSKRRELRGRFLEVIGTTTTTMEEKADILLDLAFPEKSLTKQQAMVGALARAMCMDAALNGGRLAKLAMGVLQTGTAPEEVCAIYDSENPKSPWRQDWRGTKGQPPSEKDIRETLALLRRKLKPPSDAQIIEYK